MYVLNVVVFFESFDQANHLRGLLAFELDVILRNHGNTGRRRSDTGFLDRFQHGFIDEGLVRTSQFSPSSRRSSAPASSKMPMRSSSFASDFGTTMSPFLWNIQETAPASAILPPFLPKTWRISLTVRLRLSVLMSMSSATPPGP